MAIGYEDAKAQYRKSVEDLGGQWRPDEERDFEARYSQATDGGNQYSGEGYTNTWEQELADATERNRVRYQRPTASNGGIGGDADLNGDGRLDSAYATSQYSGGGGGGSSSGGGDAALQALLAMLQGDRDRQQQERASLREILMSQLNGLQQPVNRNDPAIAGVLSANRNAIQRGQEGQRREIAERRAYDESGGVGSKAYNTDVDRMLQQGAEAGAQFEGNVLYQELNNRRQQLTQLLSQAVALGDAESARNIQAQLATIQSQLNQSNFYDTMGLNYSQLGMNANQAALMALLNG